MPVGIRGRQVRLVLCCVVLVSLAACDGVVVVEGTIEAAGAAALDDCAAVLIREDGHELGRRPIDPDFSATFTVMPGERQYLAEVSCEGYSPYRSEPFTSRARLDDPPVELGTIQLQPQAASRKE